MTEEEKHKGIRNPQEYIAELEEVVAHAKDIRRIVGHEIRNRLIMLEGAPKQLIREIESIPEGAITNEQRKKINFYAHAFYRAARQIETMSGILQFTSMKPRDLKSRSELFNLEECVRETVISFERDFIENEIKFLYEYNREQDNSIYINAHKGFMTAILNTSLINLIRHTPKRTLAKLGLRVNDSDLELITENILGQSKKEYDFGRTGTGFFLLRTAAEAFKGKVEGQYGHFSDGRYQFREIYGYKGEPELKELDAFILNFSIPMSELTYHAPKKS